MNISQLSAFHAVMTSRTLTDAATKLGRTQPAVTAAIKSLEDQLGMALFERQGRKMLPVPEAQYLLAEATTILSQLHRVRQTMRGLVEREEGTLNVAAMPGPVSMLFPRFVANFLGKESKIKVSMLARSSTQISELARAQSIDFGFCDLIEHSQEESLCRTDVIVGDCFLALPATHRLARKDKLSIADLDNEPMGSLQADHVHRREVAAHFDAQDLRFNPMVESQTFQPILQFILAGQCCAILDPLTVAHVASASSISDGIVIKRLDEVLRYSYALFSPLFRPASIIASDMRDAWSQEVLRLLEEVGANPAHFVGKTPKISAAS